MTTPCTAALAAVFIAAIALPLRAAPPAVDVAAYVKNDRFGTVLLSPSGEYIAATVPFDDKTALAIIRRADS